MPAGVALLWRTHVALDFTLMPTPLGWLTPRQPAGPAPSRLLRPSIRAAEIVAAALAPALLPHGVHDLYAEEPSVVVCPSIWCGVGTPPLPPRVAVKVLRTRSQSLFLADQFRKVGVGLSALAVEGGQGNESPWAVEGGRGMRAHGLWRGAGE